MVNGRQFVNRIKAIVLSNLTSLNVYNSSGCRKTFSKFCRRHFELIKRYHASLQKLLQQGISNPEFYADLVYKFKKIIGNPNFSDLFKKLVNHFEKVEYNLNFIHGGGSGLRLNDGFDVKL